MKFNGFTKPESKKDKYKKDYKTEFEFLKDVAIINGVPEEVVFKGRLCNMDKTKCF